VRLSCGISHVHVNSSVQGFPRFPFFLLLGNEVLVCDLCLFPQQKLGVLGRNFGKN
jgi:hypothetical protein